MFDGYLPGNLIVLNPTSHCTKTSFSGGLQIQIQKKKNAAFWKHARGTSSQLRKDKSYITKAWEVLTIKEEEVQ